MQREMRRKDRQLTQAAAEKILRENVYGVLSTVCADGRPYGVPMSYAYDGGRLYFHHTAAGGLLGENVPGPVKACFTVVGRTKLLPASFSTDYESVIAFGTLRPAADKEAALMRLVQRLSPDHVEQGKAYIAAAASRVSVYELQIEQLTGKARW